MAFDYSGLLATANRLISEFGKSATLIKPGTPTGPDYDPQPGTPVESSITLVEVDWKQMYRSETLVQTGDKFWLVSAEGSEPTLEDKISLDSIEYQLVNIEPLKPGPTLMMYTCHGRR